MNVANDDRTLRVDAEFDAVYELAKRRSGMDKFRMWQLWHFVGQAAKAPSGDMIGSDVLSAGLQSSSPVNPRLLQYQDAFIFAIPSMG